MTARVFVDSNVLVYAFDVEAEQKQRRAVESLRQLWDDGTGRLSIQVLQEFYATATRKLNSRVGLDTAREIVRAYGSWVHGPTTVKTLIRGSEISEIWQTAFWDGMILAAAEECGAEELLSEDLQHGQIIAGVKIRNPFVS